VLSCVRDDVQRLYRGEDGSRATNSALALAGIADGSVDPAGCHEIRQLAWVHVADTARIVSPLRIRYAGSPAVAVTSKTPP
jgi:hypothetical protein